MIRIFALLVLGLAGCSRNNSAPDPASEIGGQLIKIAAGHEPEWAAVVLAAKAPPSGFLANMDFVSDPKFEGKSVEQALALLPEDYPYDFVFLTDERSCTEADHPCIVVDLLDKERSRFRATAKSLASIENNLSISNMDFTEFEEAAKATGVFRGF